MDKFKLIETFTNKELFVNTSQVYHEDETEFRFDCKRLDRKGRKKSFYFRAKRKQMNVLFVNFFIEDIAESFLAAKIFNMKFLWDAINS